MLSALTTGPSREPRVLLLRRLGEAIALMESETQGAGLVPGALARLGRSLTELAEQVGWPLRLAHSTEVWVVAGEAVDSTALALGAARGLAARLRAVGIDTVEVRAPLDAEDVGRLAATLAGSLPSRPLPLLVSPRLTLQATPVDEWRLATYGRGPVAYASAVALLRYLSSIEPIRWARHRALLRRVAHDLTLLEGAAIRALLRAPVRGEREGWEAASVDAALLTVAAARTLELPSELTHGLVCGALLRDLGARTRAAGRAGGERTSGGARAYFGSLAVGVDESAAAALISLAGAPAGGAGAASADEDLPIAPPDAATLTSLIATHAHAVVDGLRRRADLEGVVDELRQGAETAAEADVVDILARALGILPVGTRVELSSGWRAVVLGGSPSTTDEWAACVRLVVDPFGQSIVPQDVDLGASSDDSEDYGSIRRVIRGKERHLGGIREQVLEESRTRSRAEPVAAARAASWPEDTRREVPAPELLAGFSDEAPTAARVRWVSLDEDTAPRDVRAALEGAGELEAAPGPAAAEPSGAGWRDLVTGSDAAGFDRAPTDASALLESYVHAAGVGPAPALSALDEPASEADALLDKLASVDESAWPAVEPTKSLIEMPEVEDDANPTHPWNHGPAPLDEGGLDLDSSPEPLWGESSRADDDDDESFADDSLMQVSEIGRVHDLLGHYMEARRWFDQQETDGEITQLPVGGAAEMRDPASSAMVSSFLRQATRGLDAGEVSALLDEVLAAANAADAVQDALRATQLRDLADYVQGMAAGADEGSSGVVGGAAPDRDDASERPFSRVPSAGSLMAAPGDAADPQTQPGLRPLAMMSDDDDDDDDDVPVSLTVSEDAPTREYDERTAPPSLTRGGGPPPTRPPIPPARAPDTKRTPLPAPPEGSAEHTPTPPTPSGAPGMARITRRPDASRPPERSKVPVGGEEREPSSETGDLHAVGMEKNRAGTPMAAIRKPPSRRKRR